MPLLKFTQTRQKGTGTAKTKPVNSGADTRVGGILTVLVVGLADPGFVHNGALAGLLAVCVGSNVMHPIGTLITGSFAGALFVNFFVLCRERLKIYDVLGMWPLHGLAGAWGGLAAGIFGSQLIASRAGCSFAFVCGLIFYGGLKAFVGIRMSEEEEQAGADLSIHKIAARPEAGIPR